MTRRRSTCLVVASLFAAMAQASEGAARSLAANTVPPVTVPQTGREMSRLAAVLDRVEVPTDFKITLFARVPDARDMAVSDDGRKVFVGTNSDAVYSLDLKAPGGPVESVKTFAPAIEKTRPHGVCFGPDKTLYVAELNRILAFPDAAAKADSPDLEARVVVHKGKLVPSFMESNGHASRACRVGPDGALYVTIGQPTNVPTHDQWQMFSPHGGAIIRMKPDGSDRTIYAGGIRNSAGLDFDPQGGKLWFTDNQVDLMGDDIPPGEINRVDEAGQTFGFPWYGGGRVRTLEWAASRPPRSSVFPQVETQAHAADLGMIFYRGTTFPVHYRRGIFSTQHGSWNRSRPIGARVMFTPVNADGSAGIPEVFAHGWLTDDGVYTGRPADVAELKDGSLLVSDDEAGAIYRISVAR